MFNHSPILNHIRTHRDRLVAWWHKLYQHHGPVMEGMAAIFFMELVLGAYDVRGVVHGVLASAGHFF